MKKNLTYILLSLFSLYLWGCKSQVGEDNNSEGGQKIYLYDNPTLGYDLHALNYGHREINGLDTVYYIIPNEVARVKDLDIAKNSSGENLDILSPQKLTAFEELHYFTGLENFRLTSNEFTSLDFSNNKKLKGLYMNYNWLDSLKIDSLKILEELEYQGSNSSSAPSNHQIKSINLTNNIELVVLELENQLLTQLDVSKNSNLKEIKVPDNPGTPITIDSLIYDQLTTKEGVARQEPSVDLPDGAVVITDINFGSALKELGYAQGPISTGQYFLIPADVDAVTALSLENKGIADITEISYFTSLITLDVDSNSIVTLDVSNNAALRVLSADHAGSGTGATTSLLLPNSIDSVSIDKTGLATVDLSGKAALEYFIAESGLITSLDVSDSPLLKVLNLRHAKSDWEAGNGVATIDLSNNSALEEINLFRNIIPNDAAITWWDTADGSVLTSLDIRDNPSESGEYTFTIPSHIYATLDTDSKGKNIIEEVSGNIPSGAVIITDVALGTALADGGYALRGLDNGVAKVYIIPTDAANITTLILNNEGLTDVSELNHYTGITKLYLEDNTITSLDLSWASSLSVLDINQGSGFSTIQTLNLPNTIDSLSMDKTGLATVNLSTLSNLEYFHANSGKISTLDVTNNPELKVLIVRHTNSSSAWANGGGLQTIDLSNNPKLEEIYLYRNQLDSDSDINWWSSSSVLTSLDLQFNPTGTAFTFSIPTHIYATLDTDSKGKNIMEEANGSIPSNAVIITD
ncbi:leucine-rich repeat domain-containing protein [Flammeovirga kamogawensis]|uniref:Leucine-rich repeat domain-containing protein n=1 Tax=Flammeovirga kamogawensis TaxID=373891 RepID=A0ABX8GQR9_9BACT|nr:hypothetical protein [Flammeovirga kamogawensis]MBB6463231.1 hypothetical protein [Flammeovirga kamogawensis]QWG05919.1 hypothetical protein KM029_11120 [Flammeovirga kamogawensis]TRX67744.1 hypothetical protein EO216_06130 [Flammeovirga kamogawensis]